MQKRVLGIDLGKASLGWAVVDLDEELLEQSGSDQRGPLDAKYKISNGKIVASGVRTFDEPIDRSGKSLLAARGEARRSRATIERKAERLRYLVKLAKQYKIIPQDFTLNELDAPEGIDLIKDWSIWKLRADALDKKLSAAEIFRILYHIANHRGFYFPTKAEALELENKNKTADGDAKSKEDKKIKGGIVAVKNAYKNSGCRTMGEYLYKKEGKKRNKKGDYSVSLYRDDLLNEVKVILQFQRGQGNSLFTPEFETRYINEVLMYNHTLDDNNIKKMIGKCELFKDELRFPKHGYAAELFTFYNRLNNLVIKNNKDNPKNKESEEEQKERKKAELAQTRERVNSAANKYGYGTILDYIKKSKNCKLTFSDLRKLLLLSNDETFNLCSYREFNPEYEESITIKKLDDFNSEELDMYDIETGEIQYNCWSSLKPLVEKYFERHGKAKNVKYYYSDIRKQCSVPNGLRFCKIKKDYCLSKNEIGVDKYLAQFEKETFVEFPGYLLLKKGLDGYFEKLDDDNLNNIAEALVYCQSDEGRKEYLQQHGITDEVLINKILELNMKEVTFFSLKALNKFNEEMAQGVLFNEAKANLGFDTKQHEKTTEIAPYHGAFEKNASVARIIAEFRKTINAINKKYGVIDEIHIEVATDVANSEHKIMRIKNGQARYKEQRDAARERCLANNINPDSGDNLLRFRLAEEQDFQCIYTGKQIYLGASENTPENQISIFDCDIDHIIPISRSFNDSLSNKVICSNLANREKRNRLPYEWINDAEKMKTEEGHRNAEEWWQKFKVRVLSGNKISGAKKYNLLREKFDEEDMKNFISRDLNNTRYATRHIAEYLREYFSFDKSQNTNIKDLNRIRVLGGGITAKLRHLWGLDKDRDESDLHHAQDAVVIACASFGNIYYICSVLKNLEIKGIRSQKKQLCPWKTFRDDLKDSLNKITVSRLVRATATGQAHKQPAKKKKGYTLIKRKNAKNVIDVTLDSMFRYDVYRNDKGYYCMPIYAIDLHKKDFKYVATQDKNEIEALEQDFVFSLYKGSMVKIVTKDNECFDGYIVQYIAQSGQFVIESINGNRCFEINTKTFEIGDYVRLKVENEDRDYVIVEYDEKEQQLHLVAIDGQYEINIPAKIKGKEKGDDGKNKGNAKYVTAKTYTKVDKEKKINISVIKDFQKFIIDRLGNVARVKKETERFSQKIKSNKQRIADRKARREKAEREKQQASKF